MDKYTIINLKLKGKSNRQIEKDTGINRKTIARYWNEYCQNIDSISGDENEVSGDKLREIQEAIVDGIKYDVSSRKAKKYTMELDAFIDSILESEKEKDRVLGRHKQQLTALQIHRMTSDAGYEISYSGLCYHLREKRTAQKEAYIRQEYEHGQRVEYDFGDVKLVIDGIVCTYHLAVFGAPASSFRWAYLYDNMKKEVFMDSHVRFFEMVQGVYGEVVYDNMKNVVSRFIGRNEKELNPDLVSMATYYGYEINVTNCFSGNEKGFVESSVKKLQKEVFAERYRFSSFGEAEEYLARRLAEINTESSINEERNTLRDYRPPLELGKLSEVNVNKYSCVQIDNNYYSVPDHLVGKTLNAKTYVKEILIYAGSDIVARHNRIYGYHEYQMDIFHYLRTFERKPGALSNSKALKSRTELLEIYNKHFSRRTREFIELLRENSHLDYEKLLDVLKDAAEHNTASRMKSDSEMDDSVTMNSRKQMELLNTMMLGGERNVN